MGTYLSAIPAYGRDYKSKKEVKIAWESGADFIETQGYACFNKDDNMGCSQINFRYSNLRKVAVLDVLKNKFN